MGSCEKYGKLYAYFLEVCRHFMYRKLHEEMFVPEFGQEMYEWLNRWLSDRFDRSYEAVHRDNAFLSEEEQFSPENWIIHVAHLDISMYFKIIRLWEPHLGRRCWVYIANATNYLCHIPVEKLWQNINQQEFNSQLKWLREGLKSAGIDRELLNFCKRNILSERQWLM